MVINPVLRIIALANLPVNSARPEVDVHALKVQNKPLARVPCSKRHYACCLGLYDQVRGHLHHDATVDIDAVLVVKVAIHKLPTVLGHVEGRQGSCNKTWRLAYCAHTEKDISICRFPPPTAVGRINVGSSSTE